MENSFSEFKLIPDNENKIYLLYDKDGNKLDIPESIAIILDGNGRFAVKNNISRALGHKAGCENLELILEECVRLGVKYLTVYAFSTENWKRSESEISALFDLFFLYIKKIRKQAMENDVRVNFIGDLSKFSDKLYKECIDLIELTKNNNRSNFIIALNYGGRDEIIRTIKKMNDEKYDFNNITESDFSKYLDTSNYKDPDLLIRTSGEFRLSNFLLWQIAYTEIYITNVLWPDFKEEEFYKAIVEFQTRDRRFGKI